MKHRYLYVLLCFLFACQKTPIEQSSAPEKVSSLKSNSKENGSYYYYYKGEKQYLKLDDKKKFIVVDVVPQDKDFKRAEVIAGLKVHSRNLGEKDFYWKIIDNDSVVVNKLSNVVYQVPLFRTSNNTEVGVSNLFFVKLDKESDLQLLESLAKETGTTIIGNNQFMPLWYTLSCNNHSRGNALEMANLFYESGHFSSAQPDLMTDLLQQCALDPYFNSQWGLRNTGQLGGTFGADIDICNAWPISKGASNVTVAVIDHGIELNHPDLLSNIHPISYNTATSSSPSQVLGNHGVAVAGIIASTSNSIGIAGVAPNVKLMSISNNLILAPNSVQQLANGINFAWQQGAHVINNSWGSNGLASQLIDDAISNAVTLGRGGRGTVVVFAAGNDNSSLTYPSTNANVIAVGAMSMCYQRKSPSSCDGENWGSNYGTGLDVMAPGVKIYTTDRQGGAGYSPNDYFSDFNGTSAAAPYVTGLAALILSVNPNLTQLEVRRIIEKTAKKIPGYNYTSGAGENTSLTWNNQVGYGLINAKNALEEALPFSLSGPDHFCNSQTYTLNNLPSGASVSWSTSGGIAISGSSSSSTVTVLKVGNGGNGILYATVNGNITLTKTITVGTPPANLSIQGPSSNCIGDTYAYSIPTTYPGATAYEWRVNGATSGQNFEIWNNSLGEAEIWFQQTGTYNVQVRIVNSCGSTYSNTLQVNVANCN